MSDNDLRGQIPDALGLVSGIGLFDIVNNRIAGTIPVTMPIGLHMFMVSENQLAGSLQRFFSQEALLVTNNKFTGSRTNEVYRSSK